MAEAQGSGRRGIDQLAAATQLDEAGYRAQPIERPDEAVPRDIVINTKPAGGQPLSRGERVQMFVSIGSLRRPLPDRGAQRGAAAVRQAAEDLMAAQFTVRRVDSPNADVPAEEVISSTPATGTERPLGSEVVVEVSSGSVPEPGSTAGEGQGPIDVAGQPAPEATSALENLRLRVEQTTVRSNQADDGVVLNSAPRAGTKVKAGETVTLNVAKPTGRVDLIKLVEEGKAQWTGSSSNEPLPFPGNESDAVYG